VLFNDAVNCGDCIMLVIDEGISRAIWWNNTDRKKREYSEKNLSRIHLAHYIAAVMSIFKDSIRTAQ